MRELEFGKHGSLHAFPVTGGSNWTPMGLCWIDDERLAWTASYLSGRMKYECVVANLGSGKSKVLAAPGTRGPVVAGETLVAGGGVNGATPKVWDLTSFKAIGSLKGHKQQLGGLDTLADGTLIATGGGKNSTPYDDTIRIWDAKTFAELRKWKVGAPISSLACSKSTIYAKSWKHGEDATVHAFTPEGESLFAQPAFNFPGYQLAVSTGGEMLAEGAGNGLLLRDASTGEVLHHDDGGDTTFPSFAPDDKLVVATRGSAFLWETATGTKVARLGNLSLCRFSPDGSKIAGFLTEDQAITHLAIYDAPSLLS